MHVVIIIGPYHCFKLGINYLLLLFYSVFEMQALKNKFGRYRLDSSKSVELMMLYLSHVAL